jgi:hypothetical protein
MVENAQATSTVKSFRLDEYYDSIGLGSTIWTLDRWMRVAAALRTNEYEAASAYQIPHLAINKLKSNKEIGETIGMHLSLAEFHALHRVTTDLVMSRIIPTKQNISPDG